MYSPPTFMKKFILIGFYAKLVPFLNLIYKDRIEFEYIDTWPVPSPRQPHHHFNNYNHS